MWVRAHQGTEGNERADYMAKLAVEVGLRMNEPDIITPAGIRQAFPIHGKAPKHLRWTRQALKGLTYITTDRGPQRWWMHKIGRAESPACPCGGWTAQNAAHLMTCHWVADGRGRRWEEVREDAEWCEKLADFLL